MLLLSVQWKNKYMFNFLDVNIISTSYSLAVGPRWPSGLLKYVEMIVLH